MMFVVHPCDEDGLGADVVLGPADHGPQQVRDQRHDHRPHHQQLHEQHVVVLVHLEEGAWILSVRSCWITIDLHTLLDPLYSNIFAHF